jgi:16S rRNA (guanine(1405)-N(7))-methyltransferase
MSKHSLSEPEIEDLVNTLVESKKYASLGLPKETVRDLILQELPRHKQVKQAVQVVRKKLHNIVAPYLGDPDYLQSEIMLTRLHQGKNQELVKEYCLEILDQHASTKERLSILDEFYPRLFEVTGLPNTILDLACGLHPFGLPWMNLPTTTTYFAYDLHKPRINLINTFFKLQNRPPNGVYQDILIQPPSQQADVAFFFKEAHRFEQRQRGCNRDFWLALQVKFLLVSLPIASLSGKHDLTDKHRRLIYETIQGLNWEVIEIPFKNELVFCIRK